MRGRKPKPTHLKLITGNPGKRPLNKDEPKPSHKRLPSPPAVLCQDAKNEWRRSAPEAHRLGLLTTIDRAAFAAYCQLYGRWIVAERALAEMAKNDPLTQGLLIQTAKGRTIENPLVGEANKAMSDMVRYAAEFGMTPSARTRLRGTPALNNGNPFAEFT